MTIMQRLTQALSDTATKFFVNQNQPMKKLKALAIMMIAVGIVSMLILLMLFPEEL